MSSPLDREWDYRTSPPPGTYVSREAEQYRPTYDPPPPDPLTDSAVRRGVGIGTVVRLVQSDGTVLDLGLTRINNVITWDDLQFMLTNRQDLQVLAPRRRWIAGGTIMSAEVLSDPEDDG